MHKRDGVNTDIPCGLFWGQDRREGNQLNVDKRVYALEDDWWELGWANYGRNGTCVGDSAGEPGTGCIQCPEDQEWCAYRRQDSYWPNTHELSHGLVYGGWPVWDAWQETRCIDDPEIIAYTGHCTPITWDDHALWSYSGLPTQKRTEFGRNLYKKTDFLTMQAMGWELRETTALLIWQLQLNNSLLEFWVHSIRRV
jgi:hypothetical protein